MLVATSVVKYYSITSSWSLSELSRKNFKLLYTYRPNLTQEITYIKVDALELLQVPIVLFGVLPKYRLKHGLIQADIYRDVVEEGLC